MKRRDFLKGLAATPALAVLPAVAKEKVAFEKRKNDYNYEWIDPKDVAKYEAEGWEQVAVKHRMGENLFPGIKALWLEGK